MPDIDLDRLAALVERMEAAGRRGAVVDPRGGVEPDGSPSPVVSGELIESQWGNAVVNTLHGWTWQDSIDGSVGDHRALVMQSKVVVVTTDAAGDVNLVLNYPFVSAAFAVSLTNAEPGLPHIPSLKLRSTTGILANVRNVTTGAPLISAATAIAWVAIGPY